MPCPRRIQGSPISGFMEPRPICHFLQCVAFGAAGAAVLPGVTTVPDDEKHWCVVKGQFATRRDFMLMNAAEPSFTRGLGIDADPSMWNRERFDVMTVQARVALA